MEINSKQAKLNDILTNSQKSQINQTGLPINWVTALFAKFQVIFGHKWVIQIEGIEEMAVSEWSQGLAGLSGEQIKTGIDSLEGEWPPSLPGFRALCLGKGVNGFGLDYVPECYRETKRERLLESDENKEKHKAAYESGMSGIKEILKNEKKL